MINWQGVGDEGEKELNSVLGRFPWFTFHFGDRRER